MPRSIQINCDIHLHRGVSLLSCISLIKSVSLLGVLPPSGYGIPLLVVSSMTNGVSLLRLTLIKSVSLQWLFPCKRVSLSQGQFSGKGHFTPQVIFLVNFTPMVCTLIKWIPECVNPETTRIQKIKAEIKNQGKQIIIYDHT